VAVETLQREQDLTSLTPKRGLIAAQPVEGIMPKLLRRFPNLKYMIVGDGDDRGRLEEKVKVSGTI
jgi:hypothetical protein